VVAIDERAVCGTQVSHEKRSAFLSDFAMTTTGKPIKNLDFRIGTSSNQDGQLVERNLSVTTPNVAQSRFHVPASS
jgi:hypothetical protein